jgi:transposase
MKQIIALFHSNQLDAKPEEIMGIYLQRWSIETFFWNAKQELGLNDCHSTDVNHIHAHLSLLFVAESLIRFAQWNYNEIEKTGLKEEVTHGKVVALLFHTRCEVHARSKDSIQVYFDTTSQRFANFFRKYWPNYLTMDWFDFQRNWEIYPQSG